MKDLVTDETKVKMRAKALGRKHSEETKAKIRKSLLGKHLSEETKEKIRAKALGRKHSKESRVKMSEAHKGKRPNLGRHWSKETREKMRLAHLDKHNPKFGHKGKKNPNYGKTGKKSHLWKGDKATEIAGHTRAVKAFKCPEGKERHHIDGNPLNNSPENIMLVTRKQHMELDGRMEKLRKGLRCHKK